MPTRGSKGEGNRLTLNLEGHKGDEERPAIAVTLLGDDAKPILVAKAANDGTVDIPPDALKKARRIVVGPATDDPSLVDPETLIRYRPADFMKAVEVGSLNLARVDWQKWLGFLRCVTGKVQLCRRSPWWYEELYQFAKEPVLVQRIPIPDPPPELRPIQRTTSIASSAAAASSLLDSGISSSVSANVVNRISAASSISELIAWPFRCQAICNGMVEVWRRTCCCEPWIIDDPRIPNLKKELREIVEGLHRVPPWPPDPPVGPVGPIPPVSDKSPPIPPDPNPPDPAPFIDSAAIFKGGALDEKALNAATDLAAIHSLPSDRVAEYINARSYLRCWRWSCGTPVQVASGSINPDGRFSVCWFDWSRIGVFGCSEEYAYVVKQRFPPFDITVYDGVAANVWFAPGADATLTSYSWWAYACRDNGEPGTGAFVFLDLIGDTESWNLKTPNSTAWNSVGAPAFNDGLLFPATAAAALGQNKNRNMGGTLKLSYMFSEDMQTAPVNAKYYRIGITPATPADMSGAPTTAPKYLTAGLSWKKATATDVVPVVLGPFSVGGQDNLYLIPFDRDLATSDDNNWLAGQYHGFVDTTNADWFDPSVRHLITLEVFDAGGVRLRPNGTPATTAGGAEATRPFVYQRRYQDLGPRANVPFGALTHMFWWDNRPLSALITQLMMDGAEFPGECLFLEGHDTSTFGIQYRAYHEEELFQLAHAITWRRGVGSPPVTGTLLGSASDNVGKPPALPGVSPTNTFAQMLSPSPTNHHPKCAFTVFLTISSKTTDGDYLGNWSITETGAFALEIH